ncbi:hypothetical protein BDZ97DRAFT_1905165 [Flammula alnicola]|nr:hypothetical protein BDZ97DRAFT_1905165 [Flammula alnicola]
METPSNNQAIDILEVAPQPTDSSTQDESASSETAPNPQLEVTPEAVETGEEAPSLDDSWKAEYEAQVETWRAQSAEAREKAEKERLKWEAIRAIEKEEAAQRKAEGIVDEPITAVLQTTSEIWEKTATDESQKWEDVPSVTSSYPSMSFPEHNETPPPSHPQPTPQQVPVSATLAIFDSSLSTRTRLTAFFSSLAVNLLLPFVNGVMLGFGEIFAKNVVMEWLGWKPSGPGSIATNVGLRGSPREERQKQKTLR